MSKDNTHTRLSQYRERFEGSSSKEGFIETASIKKRSGAPLQEDTANAEKRLMETGAFAVSEKQ